MIDVPTSWRGARRRHQRITDALPPPVPHDHDGQDHSGAPPGPPPRDPVAALQRVELFAGMDRRQSEQIARLLKE